MSDDKIIPFQHRELTIEEVQKLIGESPQIAISEALKTVAFERDALQTKLDTIRGIVEPLKFSSNGTAYVEAIGKIREALIDE